MKISTIITRKRNGLPAPLWMGIFAVLCSAMLASAWAKKPMPVTAAQTPLYTAAPDTTAPVAEAASAAAEANAPSSIPSANALATPALPAAGFAEHAAGKTSPAAPASKAVAATSDASIAAHTHAIGKPTDLRMAEEAQASFQQGAASWYGPGFHNRLTANGERFNMHALTAAHKTLPFGTIVRVKSVSSGKSVVVRINDRGPYAKGRIIDLSSGAADRLGLKASGVQKVVLYKLKRNGKEQQLAMNDE